MKKLYKIILLLHNLFNSKHKHEERIENTVIYDKKKEVEKKLFMQIYIFKNKKKYHEALLSYKADARKK